MYKLTKPNPLFPDEQPRWILRISDGALICMHEDNTDYQAYLKWVEEDNQPEAAE